MMCIGWTEVDKDRGFLLLAIFMLCFAIGPRAVSRGCTCCTTLHRVQYFSSSSEGAQLPLQVEQRCEQRPPIQQRVIRGCVAVG